MSKIPTGNEGIRDSNLNLIYGLNITNTLLQQQVTVGTTATPIPATAMSERISLLIMNIGTAPVYIGSSTVSTVDGFPLYPRAVIRIDIEPDVIVYGRAAANQNVRILEGS